MFSTNAVIFMLIPLKKFDIQMAGNCSRLTVSCNNGGVSVEAQLFFFHKTRIRTAVPATSITTRAVIISGVDIQPRDAPLDPPWEVDTL